MTGLKGAARRPNMASRRRPGSPRKWTPSVLSLLAKTARKRITYGAGIEKVCRMVLTALDAAGVLRTHPADRGVKLVWPDPQPIDPSSALVAAKQKQDLGVEPERVMAELGYGPGDAGVS